MKQILVMGSAGCLTRALSHSTHETLEGRQVQQMESGNVTIVGWEGRDTRRGRVSPSAEVSNVRETAGRAEPDNQTKIPILIHCRVTLTYQNLSFVIKNMQKLLPPCTVSLIEVTDKNMNSFGHNVSTI